MSFVFVLQGQLEDQGIIPPGVLFSPGTGQGPSLVARHNEFPVIQEPY